MHSTERAAKAIVIRTTRWGRHVGVIGLFAFAMTCAVHAEPLVRIEEDKAKPGVVTEWEQKGNKKVLLTVREDADPRAVADQIAEEVPRVRTKVRGGKVQVTGKSEGELLEALAKVDYGEDFDGALAAAEIGADEDLGSGSSLRAKKVAALEALLADQTTVALGKVVNVARSQFPSATVALEIIRGPRGAIGEVVKKGRTIRFTPVLPQAKDAVDWSQGEAQMNAVAWYLRKGDQVRVKIGKKTEAGYEAEVIARQ